MESHDPIRMFQEAYDKVKMLPVNIMVLGKSGVGKSTLINSVFRENLTQTGIGKPVTRSVKAIRKEGVPVVVYDTPGIELNSSNQKSLRTEIFDKIKEMAMMPDEGDHIHLMWYCINANANRIEEFEIEWIREFSEKVNIIVVLTQSHGKDSLHFQKFIDGLNLPVANVCRVLAQPYESGSGHIEPAFGLEDLVDVSYECLPEAYRLAFANAQKVDIERKTMVCNHVVLTFCATAFSTGFVPVPVADSAMLVPQQIVMLAKLTKIFGLPVDRAYLTYLVSAVLGTSGATVAGKTLFANILKFFPGVGTVAGGAISGSTAAVITGALGFSYIQILAKIAQASKRGETITNDKILETVQTTFKAKMSDKRFFRNMVCQLKKYMKLEKGFED